MQSETRTLIGLVILFMVFAGLSISIYYKGQDSDCNMCEIKFTTFEQSGRVLEIPLEIKIPILELYGSFINDECRIKWDRVQGYYEN